GGGADDAGVAVQRDDVGPHRAPADAGEPSDRDVVADGLRDQGRERAQVRLDVGSGGYDAGELVVDRNATIASPEADEHALVPRAGAARYQRLRRLAD